MGRVKFPPLMIAMDEQKTERLRALWKSGRDKYRSFFAVLNEVCQEIGDEALPAWCRTELFIGLSVITQIANVLGKIDEQVVKAELAAANKVEKEERAAAAATAKKAREDAARQRELEAAEHERKLAEIRA
jgi:hypothetical protein